MWKIGKIVSKGDYNYTIIPEHPNATVNGYVLEHRAIMENHLGRLLDSSEVVHHINECKKDNRIENLQLMKVGEHERLHSTTGRKMVELKCPQCKTIFVKPRNQSFLGKKNGDYNCCSPSCRGKFSRAIQLRGRTHEVELAISENLVREFISLDNSEQTVKQQDA
jgi:hypothetical protein